MKTVFLTLLLVASLLCFVKADDVAVTSPQVPAQEAEIEAEITPEERVREEITALHEDVKEQRRLSIEERKAQREQQR